MSDSAKDNIYTEQMRAWMMIQVIGQTSVNFLNIKKLSREMREHLEVLRSAVEKTEPFREGTADGAEQISFPEYFIGACLGSKSYRTAVFGTMQMSDAGAATRLAQDIIAVTGTTPSRFGLEQEARPVHEAMMKAFRGAVENADAIIEELHLQ